jgi:membrane protease YdiL (CAAX protease family)
MSPPTVLLGLIEDVDGWRGTLLWIWTLFLLLGLPLLSRPRIENPEQLPRLRLYAAIATSLWLLAFLTMVVGWLTDLRPADLGLVLPGIGDLIGWTGLAGTASCLVMGVLLLLQARLGGREPPLVTHLMPRIRRERWGFAGISLTAGICEEWIYRGFLLAVLRSWIPSLAVAVLVQGLAFGLVHGYQSRWGRVRAVTLGIVLALPVIATGSILASVLVHALLDLAAGLWWWPRLRDRLEAAPLSEPLEEGDLDSPEPVE